MTRITAAVAGILSGTCASVLALLAHEASSGDRLFLNMPLMIAIVLLVAAGQAILVGAPLLLFLFRFGWLNITTAVLAGAFSGVLPWILMGLGGAGNGIGRYTIPILPSLASYGAIGGAVFYLVFRGFDPGDSLASTQLRGGA